MLRALIREVTITTIYNASLSFDIKAQMGQHTWLVVIVTSRMSARNIPLELDFNLVVDTTLDGMSKYLKWVNIHG
jgi:hypothetical protein